MSGATEGRGRGAPADRKGGAHLGLLLLLAALLSPGAHLEAQGVESLRDACATGASESALTPCADGALAALGLQHGYGLLAAAAGPIPASPSTAGNRLQGSPRWIFDAGVSWTSFNRPDLTDGQRRDRRSLQGAPRLTVAAGLFEGLSPGPTVGGVGAIDLVAEARLLPVTAMDGLSGRVASWGAGARIGVVRESFSLPGVTLSVMHRRTGTLRYGDPDADGVQARVAPNVTSLRTVVGKDLWEIGVSGGVQRDRIRGDGAVRVMDEGTEQRSGAVSLPADRTTWFLAFNRTWVVTQFAAELGWSPGPDPVGGMGGSGEFTGPASALTGTFTFRVIY